MNGLIPGKEIISEIDVVPAHLSIGAKFKGR